MSNPSLPVDGIGIGGVQGLHVFLFYAFNTIRWWRSGEASTFFKNTFEKRDSFFLHVSHRSNLQARVTPQGVHMVLFFDSEDFFICCTSDFFVVFYERMSVRGHSCKRNAVPTAAAEGQGMKKVPSGEGDIRAQSHVFSSFAEL